MARSFPPTACVRGYGYFARRRVELSTSTEQAVEAEVKGKRVQRVRLEVEGERLCSTCTCSAELLGPAACRHVWATLLEVERQGALGALRATRHRLSLAAPKPTSPSSSATAPTTKRGAARGRRPPASSSAARSARRTA